MTAIRPAVLADRLQSTRRLAVCDVDESVLDAYIDQLRLMSDWKDDALAPTIALAELVERNVKRFLTQDARQALARCEVFVTPIAYCGAYCDPPRTVVIGSGLVDFLMAYLYWGSFAHYLPDHLSEVFHPNFPKTSVREVIPMLLLGLLYRYYAHGDPLPDYRPLANDSSSEQVRHALAAALTFILLHELGHLELRHSENMNGRARSIDLPFQVPEDFSTCKLQELEADDYARACMIESYRPLHPAWLNAALGPHVLLETVLSWRATEHPICINRLVHAQAQAQGVVDRTSYLEQLQNSVDRYRSIERNHLDFRKQGTLPLLERLTRPKLIQLLKEMDEHAGKDGVPFSAAIYSASTPWHNQVFSLNLSY